MSASENRTAPVAETTLISSDTARTAANPTPYRPTTPGPPWSRFAEARIEDSAATPASSSGAPVFAATSVVPTSVRASRSRSRPGTPARTAASAAFCASSTTTRSR
ncbi:MAG: hypothetical protein NVV66_13000 [Cellulomonas sp.]|uniref:hypothetical protein n=1 Tax=Cellulomonas sp. TaxID=40001 RepID=UPI0025840D7F|nr:hypothetical protein [Cellulomonas sp.]MCR6705557.1 hypothetical protein [Cellulomonas sp.]